MTASLVAGLGGRALVCAHQVSHIMGRCPLERDEAAHPRGRNGDGDFLAGRGPFGREDVGCVPTTLNWKETAALSGKSHLILALACAQKLSPFINIPLIGAGEVFGRHADGRTRQPQQSAYLLIEERIWGGMRAVSSSADQEVCEKQGHTPSPHVMECAIVSRASSRRCTPYLCHGCRHSAPYPCAWRNSGCACK
jgi:hypothetical protein